MANDNLPIYSDITWLGIIADGMTSINKTEVKTGSKNSIGPGPAVLLRTESYPLRVGVTVKASSVNAGRIYVGTDPDLTTNSNPDTDGFELSPGESHFFLVENINLIYVAGSQSGQKAFYFGI